MTPLSRRTFLGKSALAASVAPLALSSLTSPFVRTARAAEPGANDKIRIGLIGCGGMGANDMKQLIKKPEVQIAALCDVDKNRMPNDIKTVTDKYGKAPDLYSDYRKML